MVKKKYDSETVEELEKIKKENNLTDEELIKKLEKIQKEKVNRNLNRVLKVAGFVLVLFVFLIAFDILYEGSLFGMIFSREEHNAYLAAIGYSGINNTHGKFTFFDDILGMNGNWPITVLYTVVLVALAVLLGYVFAFSLKDIIDVIKNLFRGAGNTAVDIGDTVASSTGMFKKKKKKKSEFDTEPIEDLEEKDGSRHKEKKKKVKEDDLFDDDEVKLDPADLDKILRGEAVEKTTEIPEGVKSLFDETE